MSDLQAQIRAQVRTALAGGKAGADATVAALMERFEAGYAAHNAEAIVACFAPDVEWVLPDARVLRGRADCLALLKERFANPAGPTFSDSHMNVLGHIVVQTYRVSLPEAGGSTRSYNGTDVYQIRDGLIARKDAYWKQVGAPPLPAAASAGVVVPLRVGNPAQASALTELFKRLAASPALMQATQSGLLRFDLRVDEGAHQPPTAPAPVPDVAPATSAAAQLSRAAQPAACCDACQTGRTCECANQHCDTHQHSPAVNVPELKGVIGEKLVKTLAPSVTSVRLSPNAVMTPLGKEALRKRGITIDRGAKK